MALNKVDLCGVDTSKLPVLTNAQMKALFARIAAGDETAREELFTKSLQLADALLAHRGALRELSGLISGEIRAFIEADERYARAVNEAIKANSHFSQCLYGQHKGGAL